MTENEPIFERETYRFIRNKVSIDLLTVDNELSEIPVLIQQAGECACSAIDARDKAKDQLEKTESIAATNLRIPISTGEGKSKSRSETQIESELPQNEFVQQAKKAYAQAKLDASLWQNLCDALRTKAASIRTAADLITAGFLTTDFVLNRRRKDIRALSK